MDIEKQSGNSEIDLSELLSLKSQQSGTKKRSLSKNKKNEKEDEEESPTNGDQRDLNKQSNAIGYQQFDQSCSVFLPSQQIQNDKQSKKVSQKDPVSSQRSSSDSYNKALQVFKQVKEKVLDLSELIIANKYFKIQENIQRIIVNKPSFNEYFINFILLQVEKTHLDTLQQFNNFLFESLKAANPQNNFFVSIYQGKSSLSEILSIVKDEIERIYRKQQSSPLQANESSNLNILFIFDTVYDLCTDDLIDLAKFMEEEYNEPEYNRYQFFFLLPCTSNKKIHISNQYLQVYRCEFCVSSYLFSKFLIELIQNTQIPLLSPEVYQMFIKNFEMYSISYKESVHRINGAIMQLIFSLMKESPQDLDVLEETLTDKQQILGEVIDNKGMEDHVNFFNRDREIERERDKKQKQRKQSEDELEEQKDQLQEDDQEDDADFVQSNNTRSIKKSKKNVKKPTDKSKQNQTKKKQAKGDEHNVMINEDEQSMKKQKNSHKDQQLAVEYLNRRSLLCVGIQIMQDIFKKPLSKGGKLSGIKNKIIQYVVQPDSSFYLPVQISDYIKSASDCVEIAKDIAAILEQCKNKEFNKYIEQLIQLNSKKTVEENIQQNTASNITNQFQVKSKNQKRYEQLMGSKLDQSSHQDTTEQSGEIKVIIDLKQKIVNIIKQFIAEQIKGNYAYIIQKHQTIVQSNVTILNNMFRPDLMFDIMSKLQIQGEKRKQGLVEGTETGTLLLLLENYGREIDICSAFQQFCSIMKENQDMDQEALECAFQKAVFDLRYYGLINEGRKFRLVLEKNFFAKTEFINYFQQ